MPLNEWRATALHKAYSCGADAAYLQLWAIAVGERAPSEPTPDTARLLDIKRLGVSQDAVVRTLRIGAKVRGHVRLLVVGKSPREGGSEFLKRYRLGAW